MNSKTVKDLAKERLERRKKNRFFQMVDAFPFNNDKIGSAFVIKPLYTKIKKNQAVSL